MSIRKTIKNAQSRYVELSRQADDICRFPFSVRAGELITANRIERDTVLALFGIHAEDYEAVYAFERSLGLRGGANV